MVYQGIILSALVGKVGLMRWNRVSERPSRGRSEKKRLRGNT